MCSTLQPTCLICCSEELISQSRSSQFGDDELSKNLEIIFILKTIFEVPAERLQYFLSSFREDAPSLNNWGIYLCWNCTQSVDNVKQTYNAMVKAIRSFQEAKENIIGQLQGSKFDQGRAYFDERPSSQTDHLQKLIVKETRNFVCKSKKLNNNYKKN